MNVDKSSDVKKMLKFVNVFQEDLLSKEKPRPYRKQQGMVGLWVRQHEVVSFHPHYMVFFSRTDAKKDDKETYLIIPDNKSFKRVDFDGDFPECVSDGTYEYCYPQNWRAAVTVNDDYTFGVDAQRIRSFLQDVRDFWNERKVRDRHTVELTFNGECASIVPWTKHTPARGGQVETYPEACQVFYPADGPHNYIKTTYWTFDTKPLLRFLNLLGKQDDILEVRFNSRNPFAGPVEYKLCNMGHKMFLMYYR